MEMLSVLDNSIQGRPMHELKRPEFHVLFALSNRVLHGLAISEDVDRVTDGQVLLGPGTLYRTLQELLRTGHIEEVAGPVEQRGKRRRFYQLTPEGLTVLKREAARLQTLVSLARDRKILTS